MNKLKSKSPTFKIFKSDFLFLSQRVRPLELKMRAEYAIECSVRKIMDIKVLRVTELGFCRQHPDSLKQCELRLTK